MLRSGSGAQVLHLGGEGCRPAAVAVRNYGEPIEGEQAELAKKRIMARVDRDYPHGRPRLVYVSTKHGCVQMGFDVGDWKPKAYTERING